MAFDLTEKIKFIRERSAMEQKMEENKEAELVEEAEKQGEEIVNIPSVRVVEEDESKMAVEAQQTPLEAEKDEEMSSCACGDYKALLEAFKPQFKKIDKIYDGLVELGVIKEKSVAKTTKKKGKK